MRILPALLIGCLLCVPGICTARADSTKTAENDQVLDLALSYLCTYYNGSVGLIRECPDDPIKNNTYWIYSDNYLASQVLRNCSQSNDSHKHMADDIATKMVNCLAGLEPINQYRVLFPEKNVSESAFNVKDPAGLTLEPIGNATIKTHQNDPTGENELDTFADIAFLKAVYYDNSTIYDEAVYDEPYYYDGIGIIDCGNTNTSGAFNGHYETYKLALYIYTSKSLGRIPDPQAEVTLKLMQQVEGEGGFRTSYDSNRTATGLNNTETTCLAILALDYQTEPIPEFGTMPLVMTVFLAMVILTREARRRKSL